MPYALLDDQFHANQKVTAAGLDGAGLYARALSYCGDYTTDGFVPGWWAKAVTGRRRSVLVRLETVGLWHATGPGDVLEMVDRKGNTITVRVTEAGYFIPDFVQLNVSSAEAKQRHAEKSKAGRKGAIKRWGDSTSHSTSHPPGDGSSHSTSHSRGHGKPIARARGARGTPTPTKDPSTTDLAPPTTADAGLTRANFEQPAPANGKLEANTADPIIKLVLELQDRDNGTEHTIRANFAQLPEAAFAYTLEEVRRCRSDTQSDAGLAYTILERIADTGLIGDALPPAGAAPEPDAAKTRARAEPDWEAKARALFERTSDPEQVADWLAGIARIGPADRERILAAACADDEPDL